MGLSIFSFPTINEVNPTPYCTEFIHFKLVSPPSSSFKSKPSQKYYQLKLKIQYKITSCHLIPSTDATLCVWDNKSLRISEVNLPSITVLPSYRKKSISYGRFLFKREISIGCPLNLKERSPSANFFKSSVNTTLHKTFSTILNNSSLFPSST